VLVKLLHISQLIPEETLDIRANLPDMVNVVVDPFMQ
jgi:hypothetical protein